MTRLEKRNRENAVASLAMRGVLSGENMICGIAIKNVRFTDKGFSVDLDNGDTIACRITAYEAEKD